jgi:phage gpG-like protein
MAKKIDVTIESHVGDVLSALKSQKATALEAVGLQAERYAKTNITEVGAVDTGNLRNSITHEVDDDTAYIGTNVEYAVYVELGTGKYYPGGRKTPWLYEDAKGETHMTYGMKGRPYLKPAVEEHANDYKSIFETYLKKGT